MSGDEWFVVLISTFKFLMGPTLAAGFGYSLLKTLILTVPAGIFGTSVFFLASKTLSERSMRKKAEKKARLLAQGKEDKSKAFSKKNRFIVRMKNAKYGLYIIAFLTPPLLSIPVGSLLLGRFYNHKKITLPIVWVSVMFWGVTLYFFGIPLKALFNSFLGS